MADPAMAAGNYGDYSLLPVDHDPFADVGASMARHLTGNPAASPGVNPAQAFLDWRNSGQSWADQYHDYAQRAAGQDTQGAIQAAGNPMDLFGGFVSSTAPEGGGLKGITAYHGSPYDFSKFDISKIGTGEGAQSFGHGLYFAESQGTAQHYKQALQAVSIDGHPPDQFLAQTPKIDTIYDALRHVQATNPNANIGDASNLFNSSSIPAERRIAEALSTYGNLDTARRMINKGDLPVLDKMVADGRLQTSGKMYQVAINADPEHFLDWDKPLSEQTPIVQQKLKEAWLAHPDMNQDLNDWHNTLRSWEPEVSIAQARQAGIPGIKYLDQGSRAPGGLQILSPQDTVHGQWLVKQIPNGQVFYRGDDEAAARAAYQANLPPKQTHNYVVFDDKLIDIIKKYGIAGLIAGGGAHFSTQPVDHNPYTQ